MYILDDSDYGLKTTKTYELSFEDAIEEASLLRSEVLDFIPIMYHALDEESAWMNIYAGFCVASAPTPVAEGRYLIIISKQVRSLTVGEEDLPFAEDWWFVSDSIQLEEDRDVKSALIEYRNVKLEKDPY